MGKTVKVMKKNFELIWCLNNWSLLGYALQTYAIKVIHLAVTLIFCSFAFNFLLTICNFFIFLYDVKYEGEVT